MLELNVAVIVVGAAIAFLLSAIIPFILQYPFAISFFILLKHNKNNFIEKSKRKVIKHVYYFAYKLPNLFSNKLIKKFKAHYKNINEIIDQHNLVFT